MAAAALAAAGRRQPLPAAHAHRVAAAPVRTGGSWRRY